MTKERGWFLWSINDCACMGMGPVCGRAKSKGKAIASIELIMGNITPYYPHQILVAAIRDPDGRIAYNFYHFDPAHQNFVEEQPITINER